MAATTAVSRSVTPPLAAGDLLRRTVAESAAVAQVLLGAAVVLAAAERRSLLSSTHRGRFSPWFAGPLRGMLPTLTRDPTVLHRDLRVALLTMFAAWLMVV